MKFAKNILSFLMAIIFTVSNVGIAVHHHYCVHESCSAHFSEIATNGDAHCFCDTDDGTCCSQVQTSCCEEPQAENENCNHCLSNCKDEFEIEKLTEIFTAREISLKTKLVPTDIEQIIPNSEDFLREKNIRAKLLSFTKKNFQRKTTPFTEFNKFIILTKSTASSDEEDLFIS